MSSDGDDREADIDVAGLRAFLEEQLGEVESLELSRLEGGYSNDVIALTLADRDLILRRPAAGSEVDVLREYEVLAALTGTEVPVPEPVAKCEDESVIGCRFYLMERLEGDAMGPAELPRIATPDRRGRVSEEVVDALGAIHGVDLEARGLSEYTRPQGPRGRVEIWDAVYDRLPIHEERVRDLAPVRELGDRLRDRAPADCEVTLVHGDYRLENAMLAPGLPPRINGILDWENCTIGDPLIDVGYLLTTWRDPTDTHDPIVPEWISPYTDRDGYLSRTGIVDRYEQRFDRVVTNQRFYRSLALYQLAVGGESFYVRYRHGSAEDPLFARMETAVPALAERGLRILRGEEPL